MACCDKRKPVLVGVIILIVLTVIASLLKTPKAKTAKVTNNVQTQPSSNQVNGVGTLEAKEVITISPKHASTIGTVYANEGDHVAKGTRLAQMELSELSGTKIKNSAIVEKTRAQMASQKATIRDYSLRSPIDGIILSREAEAGSSIAAGTPVFKIANPKSVWVRAYIDERQSAGLKVGQEAVVTLRSTGDQKYTGIVHRMGMVSDRITEERVVYVTLDAPPEPLNLGEQAEVQITLSHD